MFRLSRTGGTRIVSYFALWIDWKGLVSELRKPDMSI